jgi:hypothetical protein
MAVSKSRYAYSMAKKANSEYRFECSAKGLGFDVLKSNSHDDMFLHIDFYISYDGAGPWGVDVKRESTSDEIWCEFKNVRGDDGWMYGKAKIIAYDMPELSGFVIVDRTDLMSWCEDNIPYEYVVSKHDAYKKRYTREGRKDEITRITLVDISSLSTYRVWPYATQS